jgi:hypothetical protein
MGGASVSAIAKLERVSVHTVYGDLSAARDVILPAGTREQLLARNFSRLEDVISANRGGVVKGDDVATRNSVKAVSEQNRMLGVTGAASTVNFTGSQSNAEDAEAVGIEVRFVRPTRNWDQEDAERRAKAPLLLEHRPAETARPPLHMQSTTASNPADVTEPLRQTEYELQRPRIRLDSNPLFDPKDEAFRRCRTEFDDPRFAEANKPWWKKKLTGRLHQGRK